ncbi:MAG: DUF4124 domain-containing protein [Lysobacterales bacterium]
MFLLFALNTASAESVKVYKCVDASGQTSFQQAPCAEKDSQQQLTVAGDTQANIDAANEATRLREQRRDLRAQDAATRRLLDSRNPATPPSPQRPAALAPCPPTYENPRSACTVPVRYVRGDGSTGRTGTTTDLSCVKALPSKLYLKRNGRLPAHCE